MEYKKKELTERDLFPSPYQQFEAWLSEALAAEVNEPTAMCVSTVSADHKPSSRILLLKDYGEEGFIFFTNYKSKKGKDLDENSSVALNFFWPELERQVRIEGRVQKTDSALSDEYFQSRPRGSQIGALVSSQSEIIQDRGTLERLKLELEIQYEGKPIPRPTYWGGFRVSPDLLEFWQGRPNRLHDRIVFSKNATTWEVNRLAP
jgi:pyridoxamine 5'-phosphate oxidase